MADLWRPLLSEGEATRALALARAVADQDTPPAPAADDPGATAAASLAAGEAGLAIFHTYAARTFGGAFGVKLGHNLDAMDDALAELEMPPTLFHGFSGLGWATAHIERVIADEEADLDDMDEELLPLLERPWKDRYGLADGLVGIGVYALERRPSGLADAMLSLVIDRLRERAIADGRHLTWFTPPEQLAGVDRRTFPNGHVNLGMAYGVPGVIAFLGAACLAGHAESATPLLEGAVPWLLGRELGASSAGAYPAFLAPGAARTHTRLGWCYGDTGVAAALLLAARGTGRADWRTRALAIARRAAQRPFENSGVEDAMLFQGAAGVAHIFNRLFQATGESFLADAARRWFGHVVDLQERGASSSDAGLLGGRAGVALALLAASTDVEPQWDRLLLLSARDARRTG